MNAPNRLLPEPAACSQKNRAQALNAALRLLSYRPRSVNEVKLRLEKRFSSMIVQEVLKKLLDISLLDDQTFAEFWRDAREIHRPRSASLIRRELRLFGVSGEVAEDAVRSINDKDAAYRAAQRFSFSIKASDFSSFQRRIGGRLYRRGFSAEIIRRTILGLWEEIKG